eukprot:TRINITY_DN3694_c1_g1_i1.p1 TRINITY_DN3694_c1_g1~~TRINITY_DN3694_c1_g1_i1.p1  ORF type:complete len:236 (+),score=46.34 TRINITY_DN3694_c1_g1_i1:35-742(+)
MGNVELIISKTAIEWDRVMKERKLERDWMNIEDILAFQTANIGLGRDGSIDLSHLGILFFLDDNKDGKFTLREATLFIERCCSREEKWDKSFTEFQTQLQAWCTLAMWNYVTAVKGRSKFKLWMVKALSRIKNYKTFKTDGQFKAKKFLRTDCVKTLYELFNIRQSYGMAYNDFLGLMQRAAEEKEYMPKIESASTCYDDYVPVAIVEEFALDFLTGFINLMEQLGFEQGIPINL